MAPTESNLASLQAELARRLTQPEHTSTVGNIDGVASQEIEQSRETLIRKRISQTRFWLPRTAQLLGSHFATLFRQFASSNHFNGHRAIVLDAIGFANWLGSQEFDQVWIAELAKWETLDCVRQTGNRFVRFYRFHYDFSDVSFTGPPPRRMHCWMCIRWHRWFHRTRIFPVIKLYSHR